MSTTPEQRATWQCPECGAPSEEQSAEERLQLERERDAAKTLCESLTLQLHESSVELLACTDERDAARAEVERLREEVERREVWRQEVVTVLNVADRLHKYHVLDDGQEWPRWDHSVADECVALRGEVGRLRTALADVCDEAEDMSARIHGEWCGPECAGSAECVPEAVTAARAALAEKP